MIQSSMAGLVSCVSKVLLFLFKTNINTMKTLFTLFTAILLTATAFGQDIELNGTVSAQNNQIKNVADRTGNKVMELKGNTINVEHLSSATYIVNAIDLETKESLSYKVVKK